MDVGDPALHQLMDGLNQIRKALDRHNARNVNQPPRPPAIIGHDPTDYLLSLLPHGVEVTDHDAVGDDDALLDWRAQIGAFENGLRVQVRDRFGARITEPAHLDPPHHPGSLDGT